MAEEHRSKLRLEINTNNFIDFFRANLANFVPGYLVKSASQSEWAKVDIYE